MNKKIIRSIEIYDRNTELLVAEYPLKGVGLEFLQTLFGEPNDNPMYECYKLNPFYADKLQPFVSGKIDIEKYNCYLACVGAY